MSEQRYPLEDFAKLPSFYHPAAAPDGDEVAVYYDGTGRNEIHLLDADNGEMTQLSEGDVPRNARWPFAWAPDGGRIYYHYDEAGDEQNDIYAIDRNGDVEPIVELDGQCILTDVSDDGRWLLVASDAGDQLNLYRHDVERGETEQLTSYRLAVTGGMFSPDGDRIAYVTNETEDLNNADVYVSAADGSDPRNLDIGEVGAEATLADWGPDGDRLLIGDNTSDKDRCGVYDLESDEVSWYGTGEHVEQPVSFLPDGERFVALRTRDAAVVPVVYDIDGGSRELDLPTGVASVPEYGDAAVLDSDTVLVRQSRPTQRPALLSYDLRTDTTETLIEPEYGDIDPDAFVEAEFFTFESHDDTEIEALLYDAGVRPSPAVVTIHGGPPAQDQRAFDQYVQFLTSRGYSVLQVNYRGSTGRGREFKNSLVGDWGGAEQADIAEGAKNLAEKDWVDEDRIAVFGGSYGGYSAYMQMLQYPELYSAGIAWIGVTDLHLMYEEAMPHFKTELLEKYMGDPEENYDLWRDRSPIEHVENLSAPLLIVHGVNDSRVPISQAREFREALENAGYTAGEDFEYEELGEEGHGSTDIQQKIRAFQLMADFLAERLAEPTTPTSED
ncbi:MAG: prolyl oligopeptidase family serine peptidase [Halapricum sp.]